MLDSGAPLITSGSYVSAALPPILAPGEKGTVTRSLVLTGTSLSSYSPAGGLPPTEVSARSWIWTDALDSSFQSQARSAIPVIASSLPGIQRDNSDIFLSGIFFGIAGGAAVSGHPGLARRLRPQESPARGQTRRGETRGKPMTGSRSRALARALAVITLGAMLSSCGGLVSTTSMVTSSAPDQGSSSPGGAGSSSGPPVTSTTATNSSSTTTTTTATITVPDVNSQPLAEAIQNLTQAGLMVGQQEQRPNLSVPHQSVIATDPPVGTPEPAGFAVKLIISAGPPGCPNCARSC